MNGAKAFRDHYTTLGVPPNASRKQIRSARNRLLRQHHPDFNPESETRSKEKTVAILLAAKVLLDDDARREYDRTYRYVHGSTTSATASTHAAAGAPSQGVACESCGRHNGWGRTYCLYCGAGIGGASPGVRLDDVDFDDLNREDPTGAFLHFGCGALLALPVFALYGLRLLAISGLDDARPLVAWMGLGVLAFGFAAVRLRDRFWRNLHFVVFLVLPLTPLVVLPFVLAHETWTWRPRDILGVAFAIVLLGVALFLLRGLLGDVVSKLLRRRGM